MGDYAKYLVPRLPSKLDNYVRFGIAFAGANKISYNLMDYYNDLAVSDSSSISLDNLNVSKLYLFAAIPDDAVVPFEDQQEINSTTSSLQQNNKEIFHYELNKENLDKLHFRIRNSKEVQEDIKEVIK